MTDAAASVDTGGDSRGGRRDPGLVDDPGQLSPAWFDAVLGTAGTPAAVRRVATEPVGTGQMASTLRARLDLENGTARTVVVKYGRADVESALAGMAYAKEVAFYVELGDRVAIRTPRCHYAAIDESHPRFVLVLEDMADARQGDQIAGCTVDHAGAALANLAGLHGPTWCDDGLAAATWLGGNTDITPDLMGPVLTMAADAFAERFAAYHRHLGEHGVTGYRLDECIADYRLGMLHGPLIILLGRLTAGVTERGDEMFRAMWRRSATAIDDLGTLDLVRARIAAT